MEWPLHRKERPLIVSYGPVGECGPGGMPIGALAYQFGIADDPEPAASGQGPLVDPWASFGPHNYLP